MLNLKPDVLIILLVSRQVLFLAILPLKAQLPFLTLSLREPMSLSLEAQPN